MHRALFLRYVLRLTHRLCGIFGTRVFASLTVILALATSPLPGVGVEVAAEVAVEGSVRAVAAVTKEALPPEESHAVVSADDGATWRAHGTPMVATHSTSGSPWFSPLNGALRPTRAFDLPNGPYQAGHRGIDLDASPSALVRAPTDGTVTFTGIVVDRPVLSIAVAPDTVVTLEPVHSTLLVGDTVRGGDPVGTVAAGGHCETRCLHLGVRVNDTYVNPLKYYWPKPVLLPW